MTTRSNDALVTMRYSSSAKKRRPIMRRLFARFTAACIGALLVMVSIEQLLFLSEDSSSLHWELQSVLAPVLDTLVHRRLHVELKDAGFCPITSCPSGHTMMRDAWQHEPEAPDQMEANKLNQWANATFSRFKNVPSFRMLTRDKTKDRFISGVIQSGKIFNAEVLSMLLPALTNRQDSSENPPVFIDVGTNIGYFSSIALALGSRVISFEPFRENAATFMSTVRKNEWVNRSTLYMNAVSYESLRVSMESTNNKTNLSNMYITGMQCRNATTTDEATNGTHGVDYMDAVSLDQVLFQNRHADIEHVHAIKIDVETHEVQVINGGMYFLCNRRVDMIIMEIEYLKSKYNLGKCNFDAMQDRLKRMGYRMYDPTLKKDLTDKSIDSIRDAEVAFVHNFKNETPAKRLKGTDDNPCEGFEL